MLAAAVATGHPARVLPCRTVPKTAAGATGNSLWPPSQRGTPGRRRLTCSPTQAGAGKPHNPPVAAVCGRRRPRQSAAAANHASPSAPRQMSTTAAGTACGHRLWPPPLRTTPCSLRWGETAPRRPPPPLTVPVRGRLWLRRAPAAAAGRDSATICCSSTQGTTGSSCPRFLYGPRPARVTVLRAPHGRRWHHVPLTVAPVAACNHRRARTHLPGRTPHRRRRVVDVAGRFLEPLPLTTLRRRPHAKCEQRQQPPPVATACGRRRFQPLPVAPVVARHSPGGRRRR